VNSMILGRLYGAILLLMNLKSSNAFFLEGLKPGFSITKAFGTNPLNSSGLATTADSATRLCVSSSLSISKGPIL